ncbi:MAG TPA: hypothetical protein VLN45_12470 [Ignavibacteriaceae bacterium]|jgi:hypothetical protein|nr:hypothetical protein [Ignavibacteriaceae bacterium]
MKTEIFASAICNRNKIKFLYGLNEILLEPYYIMTERSGKKVIYGRPNNSNEVRKFEFNRIANIKILNASRFSPIIRINRMIN